MFEKNVGKLPSLLPGRPLRNWVLPTSWGLRWSTCHWLTKWQTILDIERHPPNHAVSLNSTTLTRTECRPAKKKLTSWCHRNWPRFLRGRRRPQFGYGLNELEKRRRFLDSHYNFNAFHRLSGAGCLLGNVTQSASCVARERVKANLSPKKCTCQAKTFKHKKD